tara:strand:+ start:264 stop:881 length:618 start_codon:yes stop_codon:yes gene_type:complete
LKIYFDGDSFTYGGGLKDPTNYRWSKLVCDHFGAEETNLSKAGVSNQWVLRHLFAEDNNLEKYDIIFIQLTYPDRFECWDKKKNKWRSYSSGLIRWCKQNDKLKNMDSRFIDYIDYYSNHMYSDKQGMVNELIAYNSIVSYLKLLGKPFFMSSLSGYGHIKYDLNFHKFNHMKISSDDLHPSILGHKQIAKKVLSILKGKYEDLF